MKIDILLVFSFGLIIAGYGYLYALEQPRINALQVQQEQAERERNKAIIGWVKQNKLTKELYYEEVKKP